MVDRGGGHSDRRRARPIHAHGVRSQLGRLVRLTWAHDWLWLAIAVLLLAIAQFAIEIRLRQLNPFETTVELPTVLASAYLLGGSIVAWFRAGSIDHTDLHE